MDVEAAVHEAAERIPSPVRAVLDGSRRHHLMLLAAGLAFFGLISFAPALGLAFATLRAVAGPEVVDRVVEALKNGITSPLGFAELFEQMEGKTGRYVGVSLLLLVWPATTMASGWQRALDAILEHDSAAVLRGLLGRLKGLLLGLLLLAGTVAAFTALVLAGGTARVLIAVGAGASAVALAFLSCLLLFRYFPTDFRRPWRALLPGAGVATAGMVVSTAAFVGMLLLAGSFERTYPSTLITAIVIGLWLQLANMSLLLGEEVNVARGAGGEAHNDERRTAPGDEDPNSLPLGARTR